MPAGLVAALYVTNFMQCRSVRDCRLNRWDANLFQFTGCPSLRGAIALTGDQPEFVNHVLDVPLHFLLGECFHFWLPFAFVSLRRDFDRGLNLEFHGSRTELEGIAMDFKKFIADLTAGYRKLTGQTSSSSLASPGTVEEVDAATAAHEARLQVGYEAGHAEGYEDGYAHGYEAGREAGHELGYKKGYDEGFQMGLEARTPPEPPPPPPSRSEPPPPKPQL